MIEAAIDDGGQADPIKPKKRWNWWKIGFFVMLFLFECAREWAVVVSYEPPKISVSDHVTRVATLVSATGRWTRTDDGSPLTPSGTSITCWENEGRCYEVSYNILDGYARTPTLEVFDAKFADDAVTYQNDVPDCARYSVRIDLQLKQVLATRERKDNPGNPMCRNMERQIHMKLADGFQPYLPAHEHFLPILWLAGKLLGN
jgi:hypothetical protein